MVIEYFIPKNTQVIFVSDMYVSDYPLGGAELTTEAIIEKSPYKVFKLHSASLTEKIVKENKDKYWILTNWSGSPQEGLISLVNEKCRFSFVEYDYKLCRYRSSHLHELQEKKSCNCHNEKHGKFVEAFYSRAEFVYFMSEGQRQEYFRLFPRMKQNENKYIIQSSVWTDKHLETLRNLRETSKENKINKWAVLSGATWIKDQQGTEQYCKNNNIEYDLIGGLPYEDFIKKLSQYRGLIFKPKGFDTAPRIVIESKLLGLKLDLNSNVQHSTESWFSGSIEETEAYLNSAGERFWSKIKL